MDYKNILTEPKNISKLLIQYFSIFFKNIKLLVTFNVITLVGFYLFIGQIESINFSDNYIFNYLNKSLYYVLFFTFPVSFIYSFYLTISNNKKPNPTNIIDTFLSDYKKILFANAIFSAVIFFLNFFVKSELMMKQFYNPIFFFFVEIINTIIYFFAVILVYQLSPFKTSIKKYFSNTLIKYVVSTFILMLISMFLYRISFNVVVIFTQIFSETIGEFNPEYLFKYGSILIEYCNTISVFTILIFIYFNYTTEVNNTFEIDEINQINLGQNDDDDDEI